MIAAPSTDSTPILALRHLDKRFGALHATRDVSLDVREGEIHALIGPNGAGKSTLIGQISGELQPDAGSVWLGGRDITGLRAWERPALGMARAFQISQLYLEFDAATNVALALITRDGGARRWRGAFNLWRPLLRDARLMQQAMRYLDMAGLTRPTVAVAELSHGERRQLEIAIALAQDARLLLLDEPMAGMSADESARMTELLDGLRRHCSILLIEHDMDAVFALADRITVLVQGAVLLTGTVGEVRGHPAVRSAYLGDEDAQN
ncbi:ABC transporter ATP-binding protein [Verticiella sediminum]|uniref:ABC transporter ATP-binding protein n=1 Tax=Verticiella sediminum TaxID=1247510 RepID=A0A556AXI5_9BURK|nr:ABC transporter ATP-binding protein [Verticiella sediminum]TSH97657.1 ABC transporter ATP-binding protein [Verticiella sediminum]